MKKQMVGLGLILFGILLVLADLNGIIRIPLLGDLMSVNTMSLICGIIGLGMIAYQAYKKEKA